MATPEKKSDVDPNFSRQCQAQQRQAQAEGDNRLSGEPVQWNMPERLGWSGDLFDLEGVSEAFNRDQANQDYEKATNDVNSPGMVGDLTATLTQIDLLATMERAFRARHGSRMPRMLAHLTAVRKFGHGRENGVFTQSLLDYAQGILKQMAQG